MYKALLSAFLFAALFVFASFSAPRLTYAAYDRIEDCQAACGSGFCSAGDSGFSCVASTNKVGPPGIFGRIAAPPGVKKSVTDGGLVGLLTAVLQLMVVIAGIYALFNFVIAGYQFMNAGGDSKAVSSAWARIWQSMMGVVIVASAFLFAAIIGQIFFGDATAILSPRLYKP